MKRGVLSLLTSVMKHAVLLIMIFAFKLLITKGDTLTLPVCVLCCGACFAMVDATKNRQSLMCTVGAVLICFIYALIPRGMECIEIFTDATQIQEENFVFLHLLNEKCKVINTYDREGVSFSYHPGKVRNARKFVTMVRWVFNWRPAGHAGIGPLVSWLSSGSKP